MDFPIRKLFLWENVEVECAQTSLLGLAISGSGEIRDTHANQTKVCHVGGRVLKVVLSASTSHKTGGAQFVAELLTGSEQRHGVVLNNLFEVIEFRTK